MPKSLTEIRSSPKTGRPERTYEICLSQSLVAEAQRLEDEKANLILEATRRDENGDPAGPPRKMAEKPSPRLEEVKKRLDELLDEMDEHTGVLTLRATDGGTWRRWADENPARETGRDEAGYPIAHPLDEKYGYGLVNASALLPTLGSYAAAWNGDPMVEGDWQTIAENAASGDLAEICKLVVQMHETSGVRPGKSRRRSSETTDDAADSNSPEN